MWQGAGDWNGLTSKGTESHILGAMRTPTAHLPLCSAFVAGERSRPAVCGGATLSSRTSFVSVTV